MCVCGVNGISGMFNCSVFPEVAYDMAFVVFIIPGPQQSTVTGFCCLDVCVPSVDVCLRKFYDWLLQDTVKQ
jgi:hypothetical protein